MGLLDKTIEFLIDKGEQGAKERVISYGEFERKIGDMTQNKFSDVNLTWDIFSVFHPGRRPVLWRLLITQAIIFHTLQELKKADLTKINDNLVREILLNISPTFIENFNWQNKTQENMEQLREPFMVAKEYLSKRF